MDHDDLDRRRAAQRGRLVDALAARGISDQRVLRAVGAVPRHRFVPEDQVEHAYEDRPLPIGRGQTISQPYVVARTAEALDLRPGDRVLDVGTGSGYAAAVLAHLAHEVWSIERHAELAARARDLLDELGLAVRVVVGDGTRGLPEQAPFDAIAVAAAPEVVPPALLDQLADGGRLVIPVGPQHGTQDLVRHERRGEAVVTSSLGGVRFVPLVAGS